MGNKKEVLVNTKEDEKKLKEIVNRLDKKMEEILNDPEVAEKCEEYRKKYGTFTWEQLHKQFTI